MTSSFNRLCGMMDGHLKDFFSSIEEEYNIPKDTIWRKWKEDDKHVKKDTINKKSDYQIFFSSQRNRMVKENPNLTFGEISKQVSAMWKNLTPHEKLQTTMTPSPSFDDIRSVYTNMSVQELKASCKEKNIGGKLRKKDDIVEALVNWEETKHNKNLKQENSKGRSKLEISAEDKEEEEDDFYFHGDEDEDNSDSVVAGDDDDDTGLLTSDDDDIFDDDD